MVEYNGPCEAGCMHFHGGEVRHIPECGHYADSLTKVNADRIEALEAESARLLVRADELGFHCTGCGHLCGDPERDIAMIRKAGGRSCCPERKMEPLSAALKQEGGE